MQDKIFYLNLVSGSSYIRLSLHWGKYSILYNKDCKCTCYENFCGFHEWIVLSDGIYESFNANLHEDQNISTLMMEATCL